MEQVNKELLEACKNLIDSEIQTEIEKIEYPLKVRYRKLLINIEQAISKAEGGGVR